MGHRTQAERVRRALSGAQSSRTSLTARTPDSHPSALPSLSSRTRASNPVSDPYAARWGRWGKGDLWCPPEPRPGTLVALQGWTRVGPCLTVPRDHPETDPRGEGWDQCQGVGPGPKEELHSASAQPLSRDPRPCPEGSLDRTFHRLADPRSREKTTRPNVYTTHTHRL